MNGPLSSHYGLQRSSNGINILTSLIALQLSSLCLTADTSFLDVSTRNIAYKYMKTNRIAVSAVPLGCQRLLVAIASSAGCSSMRTVIRALPSQQQHLLAVSAHAITAFFEWRLRMWKSPVTSEACSRTVAFPYATIGVTHRCQGRLKGLSDTPPRLAPRALPSHPSPRIGHCCMNNFAQPPIHSCSRRRQDLDR